jgi:Mn-dependent DtxR family transcriptional regulator
MAKVRHGYYSEKVKKFSYFQTLRNLNKSQKEVFEIIEKFGPISTEEIALRLRKYPHSITPRVYELREMGLVEFYDVGVSETTGRAVSLWKAIIKDQLELPFED